MITMDFIFIVQFDTNGMLISRIQPRIKKLLIFADLF